MKRKTSWNLKWNSFVHFTVNKINVESRHNNSRRGREKQKETKTGKSKDHGNFTFYLCLRPSTDYVYTLFTSLSLLYLLLLDSFVNEKKYLIPFKSIIPNTPKWHSELKEVTTTTTNNSKTFIIVLYLILISFHAVTGQNTSRGAPN